MAGAADPEPIRIGALIVLTGQYAMQGNAFREGLELAASELNERGGIKGRKIEVHAEDTANLPLQALSAARKLIDQNHVIAAITTSYPELGTGAAEFQKQKIPVVHLWDSSPEIESMGDYIFGIGPWAPSSGEEAARFAAKSLRAKTAVIVHINDPWSQLVADYFKAEFSKDGGEILQTFAFNPQDLDFRSAFAKIRSLKPGVIYSPVTDNIVPFYTQLKQANINVPAISSGVIAEEHIVQKPEAFEGIYQTQIKDPNGPDMDSLAAAYEKKFKTRPALPWYIAIAYDGLKLIGDCLEKGEVKSTAVKDCIAGTKDFPGVTRSLSFNEGGSSPQMDRVFKIVKGKFVVQD